MEPLKTSLAFTAAVGLGAALLFPLPAAAWDSAVSGKIGKTQVTAGPNFGFRVSLVGISAMCTGGGDFAFLYDTDSNYKTFVAALLMAKAQGTQVTVYSTRQGSYCHIEHIDIAAS